MNRPYIPAQQSLFATWLTTFAAAITASPATYGLAAADAAAITAAKTAYTAALNLVLDPATRTSPNIAAKDLAKAGALITARQYAMLIQANAGVSNLARSAAGLTVRTSGRTPIPAPGTEPNLGVVGMNPGVATLSFADTASPTTKAKPFGAIQMEIWESIGTAPATDPEAATFRGLYTKSPFGVDFGAGDRGKICTMWARWVTRRGLVGPWSAPITFTIS